MTKVSFGFGENVCWRQVRKLLLAMSVGSEETPPRTHSSKWITRIDAKVDRVACPWLIQRFIDPRADFSCLKINFSKPPANSERFLSMQAAFLK